MIWWLAMTFNNWISRTLDIKGLINSIMLLGIKIEFYSQLARIISEIRYSKASIHMPISSLKKRGFRNLKRNSLIKEAWCIAAVVQFTFLKNKMFIHCMLIKVATLNFLFHKETKRLKSQETHKNNCFIFLSWRT